MPKFQAPKGTRDLLPPESKRARRFVGCFADLVEQAGFGQVVPPMFEDLDVFLRLGEATDVVTKEMYDFTDKGGRRIALRPEQTASIVRAFVQYRPKIPWKAWYAGPNFRYERAQRGRWRQFDQVGVEVLGTDDPDADVEVIALGWRFYETLGLRQLTLKLNSLGDGDDRARFAGALEAYLNANASELSEQSRATLATNPLRVLDSKRQEDAAIIDGAPSILDFLSDEAAAAFELVQSGLTALGVPFVVEPRLVRGLDYYTRTLFEYAADRLESAQDAVGGGGRYDGLVEALGGPPTPGIGFALGVDRTLLACDEEGAFPAEPQTVDVFVVDTTGGRQATELCDELRRRGISADRSFGGRAMGSQLKQASGSGARVAVIVGDDELAAGTVTLRDLRASEQRSVDRPKVFEELEQLLS